MTPTRLTGHDGPSPTSPTSPMSPLQRLIYDTTRTNDWSYTEVSRKSGTYYDEREGQERPRVSKQRVQQMVETPISRSPDPRIVQGLAAGLELSPATVREAVAESLGLRVLRDGPSGQVNEIVEMVGRLPKPDQERWVRLARQLARELADYPTSG